MSNGEQFAAIAAAKHPSAVNGKGTGSGAELRAQSAATICGSPLFKPTLGTIKDFVMIVNEGHRKILSVPIAKSSEDSRVVYVTCGLHLCVINDEEFGEFYFEIDVLALDGVEEPFTTQDRNIARPYIPDKVQGNVMGLVGEALDRLLRLVDPPRLFFLTKGTNLPGKALAKYATLAQVAERNGFFMIDEGTDPLGRRYWKLGKNATIEAHVGEG